jgi:hypothetical protein
MLGQKGLNLVLDFGELCQQHFGLREVGRIIEVDVFGLRELRPDPNGAFHQLA